MNEQIARAQLRYEAAAHAMQAGVAAKMLIPGASEETQPKHLRVGVNNALSGLGALANLLVEKGVISKEEYLEACADFMEAEKAMYEQEISNLLGHHVTLR